MQILFEFEIRHPDVIANILLETWPQMSTNIHGVIPSYCNNFATAWQKDIENILMLLKLFPANNIGKYSKGTVKTFEKATEKFIILSKVFAIGFYFFKCSFNFIFLKPGAITTDKTSTGKISPFIIAIGEDKSSVSNYLIQVEKELINVSCNKGIIM